MNETKNENYQAVGDGGITRSNSKKREPFFIVPSGVFEYGLSPYELSVLLYLMMRADNETHSCFPSVSSMIRDCKMSDRKARESIRALEEKKIIKVNPQYVSTRKGFNRQASNYYTIALFQNHSPPALETVPHCTQSSPPLFDIQPPPAPPAEEINKTKPIITKLNITIPTELSIREAEAAERKRNSFLDLKKDCFEKLKKDFEIDEDDVLLLDRALENLWHKKEDEYEGIKYDRSELQEMLVERSTPRIFAYCVKYLKAVREPIRSPIAYLSKCVLGTLIRGEQSLPNAEPKSNINAFGTPSEFDESTSKSSFDLDEFFEAALRRTYGDLHYDV